MALPTQVADFNFAGGLQQSQDPKQQSPASAAQLDNCIFGKDGRLDKRYGFNTLSSLEITGGAALGSSTAGDPRKFIPADGTVYLTTHKGQLRSLTGNYSRDMDDIPMWDVEREPLVRRAGEPVGHADVCVHSSTTAELYAYQTGTASAPRIRVRLYSRLSRTILIDDEVSSSDRINPKCLTIGNTMIVFYCDTSGNIYRRTLDPTSSDVSLTAEATVTTGLDTAADQQVFDVCAGPGDDYYVVLRENTPRLRVRRIDGIVSTHTTTIALSVPSKAIGCSFDGTRLWIGYYDSSFGEVRAANFTADLLTLTGPSTLSTVGVANRIGVTDDGGTEGYFIWEHKLAGTDPYDYVAWRSVNTAGSLGSGGGRLNRVHLQSKPIYVSEAGRYYVVVGFWRPLDSATGFARTGSLHLIDITSTDDARLMAHFAELVAHPRTARRSVTSGGYTDSTNNAYSNLSSIARITDGLVTSPPERDEYLFAAIVARDDSTTAQLGSTGLDRVTGYLSTRWHSDVLGPNPTVACGLVSHIDDMYCIENNFAWYPWVISDDGGDDSGAPGTGLANGDYNYVVLYEAIDERDQVYWSRVSEPYTVTVDNSGWTPNLTYVTLEIPHLHLTNRQDTENGYVPNVRIKVFRSTVGGSAPYYQIGNDSTGLTVDENDPTSTTALSFVDKSNDSDITDHPQPYISGGVEDNDPPPPARFVVAHKNRLWLAGCEDRREIRFSKDFLPGEAPGFPAANVLRLDDTDGVTGIASLDDALVIFTERGIYRVYGSGPNDTGAQSDLTDPSLVTTEVGCADGYHILSTRHGLLFRGGQSIYLLDRSFQVHDIGRPVVDELQERYIITGACIRSGPSWVQTGIEGGQLLAMFSVKSSDSDYRILVYDMERSVWLRWHVRQSTEGDPEDVEVEDMVMTRSAEVYGSDQHLLLDTADRVILQESISSSTIADPGSTYVERTIVTPWYTPAGPQGWFRPRFLSLLGERIGSHKLTVSMGHDYNESTWTTVGTWTHAQLSALTLDPAEVIRVKLPTYPAIAVRFRIQEQEDDTDGTQTEGMHLSGIRLGFALKRRRGVPLENNASRA